MTGTSTEPPTGGGGLGGGGGVMTGEPAVLNDQTGPVVVPLLFLATTCQ
jgi:hypothetical protein